MLDELEKYLDLFLSYENPILFTVIFSFVLFGFTYLFLRFFYFPLKKKHITEKNEWELRQAKLMSIFAELDPDPLFRVDPAGIILLVNDSAKKMFPGKKLLGEKIESVIPELTVDIPYIHN
jgi:PAS domain-containing protein